LWSFVLPHLALGADLHGEDANVDEDSSDDIDGRWWLAAIVVSTVMWVAIVWLIAWLLF
jgi:hypothetical protein